MRKIKKILALMMVGVLSIGTFSGCGKGENNKSGNSTKDIEIRVWQAGMGIEWLDAVIEGFKKAHPEYNVVYTATADAAAVTSSYRMEDIDTTDLYFALKSTDTINEPLNDLLDSKGDGESKTLREKFDSAYLDTEICEDGNVYSLTYGGGVVGIVYNTELFEKAGITQLPRTTNELSVVCDTLFRKGITPWCHFKQGGYWHMMTEVFASQYDSLDYTVNTFYASKDEKGNSPSKDVFMKKDGRYQALKVYEKILSSDYVVSGSNSADHVTMQTQFINDSCAMMVNGSWIANEMKSVSGKDVFMTMKMPVISSITDKLDTVKKDSELCKLIDAIDAVTDGTAKLEDYKKGDDYVVDGLKVSNNDWDYVYAARNTVAQNYSGHGAYIPSYSNAKDGAKEFLKYLYSDEGYKIYMDALHLTMPLSLDNGDVDTSSWSKFEQGQVTMLNNAVQLASAYNAKRHKIFVDGGATNLFGDQSYIQYFCSQNAADSKTADQVWDTLMDYIDKNYEGNWLANIK